MLLQLAMFDQVNAPYLQQTVLGQATTTEDAAEQAEITQDTSAKESAEDYLKHNETAEDYGMSQEAFVAYQATLALRDLVSQKFYATETSESTTVAYSADAREDATLAAEQGSG